MAKAIELNPEDLTYRAELAVVNLRVGRYEEALHLLKTALEKDPNYAEAYRPMGIAQLQMKKDKEACASFAKADVYKRQTLESYRMVCRLIEGRYPNYNSVIPQNTPYKVTVDRLQPVSDTHLDVYKRQVYARRTERGHLADGSGTGKAEAPQRFQHRLHEF